MEFPTLTSVEGAYAYLIGSILLVALVLGVYVAAVAAGLVPGPAGLAGLLAPVVA